MKKWAMPLSICLVVLGVTFMPVISGAVRVTGMATATMAAMVTITVGTTTAARLMDTPEPSTLIQLGSALAGFAGMGGFAVMRRRLKKGSDSHL